MVTITKNERNTFDRGIAVFEELIKRADAELPDEYKHIIDKHNATLAELKEVSECVLILGIIDQDLAEVPGYVEVCEKF